MQEQYLMAVVAERNPYISLTGDQSSQAYDAVALRKITERGKKQTRGYRRNAFGS